STPATRPMKQSSGAEEKSLVVRPPRPARNAARWASRPRPSAEVALYAAMASDGMREGKRKHPEAKDRPVYASAPSVRHLPLSAARPAAKLARLHRRQSPPRG